MRMCLLKSFVKVLTPGRRQRGRTLNERAYPQKCAVNYCSLADRQPNLNPPVNPDSLNICEDVLRASPLFGRAPILQTLIILPLWGHCVHLFYCWISVDHLVDCFWFYFFYAQYFYYFLY